MNSVALLVIMPYLSANLGGAGDMVSPPTPLVHPTVQVCFPELFYVAVYAYTLAHSAGPYADF